jgi:membrane protease YdiL (CAAX protease family)
VNGFGDMTAAEIAAGGLEILVLLAGIWTIGWLTLSPRGRPWMAPRLPAWDISPMDFACFLSFAFLGAAALGSVAALALRHARLGPDASLVAGGAVMHAGVLLGLAGFFLMYGARARSAPGALPRPPWALSGILAFAASMPLVFGASYLWEWAIARLGLPYEKQDLIGILENSHSAALKVLLLLVAVFIVPVTEEAIFRAGLYRYLRTRIPKAAAVVLTSLLFAALHVHWGGAYEGLASVGPLFTLAAVFCLAYERTGRIGTVMVAHAIFNLNEFVLVVSGIGS